ncbi:MAG: formylmethanofuran dehydrogenase subunit C [Methanomicrobiales archaeon]|nr:formylmethanofuran dehydrogenase subunit C [Methanomicrobiales archaeon]
MKVVLTTKPRKNPRIPVEAELLIPESFLDPSGAEELTVWEGNRERGLSDLFDIHVEGGAEKAEEVQLVVRGDTGTLKRVGERMTGGRILIEGDIGMHCGNLMKGGTIEIAGNADAWLGREMLGGEIRCRGNANHYLASGYRGEKFGMKGGVVEVFGNAGDYTAEYLSGGKVIVHGNAGDLPGIEMAAGTLVIMGDCRRACGNMTGGEVYIHGTVHQMLPTFRKVGEKVMGEPPAPYSIFTGDIANRGKGTIFIRNYQYLL